MSSIDGRSSSLRWRWERICSFGEEEKHRSENQRRHDDRRRNIKREKRNEEGEVYKVVAIIELDCKSQFRTSYLGTLNKIWYNRNGVCSNISVVKCSVRENHKTCTYLPRIGRVNHRKNAERIYQCRQKRTGVIGAGDISGSPSEWDLDPAILPWRYILIGILNDACKACFGSSGRL